jgi:hypothetical protein
MRRIRTAGNGSGQRRQPPLQVRVREDECGGAGGPPRRNPAERGMGKEAEEAGREPEVQTTSATGRKEWTGRVDDEMGVHFSRA